MDLKFLTESEITALFKCDRTTLWRWRHARKDPLPCYKVGLGSKGKLLFLEEAILAWLARRATTRKAV